MRIAFLHPYRMADHFFVEAVETAMVTDLCADGHDAEAVDFVFEPERSEAEQIAEMRAALIERAYDVVFLERPWSDDLVRALDGMRVVPFGRPELVERGLATVGVAETRRSVVRDLVRALSEGRALDDVPGLVLAGPGGTLRHTPHASEPFSVLGELRDASFDHRRRRVLSRTSANPTRAVVVSNLGCAYRHAPNRTTTFDGVDMPADLSTAGCTFCDASAYEKMTEAEAIDLVVRQVRAVLRDRPEVSQIAIKDDFAVRFLGPLGDALRDVGIGSREVLLSARADYLLEFRKDIEEALAGRFPAPLGFYLLGFENFAHTELERFNKGMHPAQIERTLVLMREWAERFPGRFEITPTGGFILFTPWTTIEDLRDNANAMRQLGFERFRGRALLSQLRLYPNLPLYWLAKKDGLLVDELDRPDASDARRRGYEADSPWRFREDKVARVHRALLDSSSLRDDELFDVFERALDDAAGVPRGGRGRRLRLVRAPRDLQRPVAASQTVHLNHSCNQACTFCHVRGAERHAPRERAARAIAAVQRAAHQGVRTIVLTGAEPLLEWYLPETVRLARDLGVADVVLETNATELAAHGGAVALARAGLTGARVAFNSADPAVADAISRDPGGHARTVSGVRDLLAAGVRVELAVALVPGAEGALASVVQGVHASFGEHAGRVSVVARWIHTAPRGARVLPVEEAARELEEGCAAAREARVRISAAPGGELPPCVFEDPESVRDVLRIDRAIVARDAGSYERIEACGSCELAEVCPGPLRGLAARVAERAKPIAMAEPFGVEEEIRRRVLSEYKSELFLEAPSGRKCDRVIVRVVFHCNQACDFCFVSRELPPVEHERIVAEIESAAARGAIVDLSGGEPTLHPRLCEYIRLATDRGVPLLELQTNAIHMADPEYARALHDAGLRQAFVSLHGVTAAVSDRVTAAPGTFDKTVAGIQNLLSAGVAVRLNFVLCGYNAHELATMPDFVAQRFAGRAARVDVNFSFVAASTDNVPRDTRLIPRFSSVAGALETAHERATALGIDMTGFDSKCGVPACYLPSAIRERHFERDLRPEEMARVGQGFTKSEACKTCELDLRCYGVRASYAEMYGTGELRPIRGGRVISPDSPPADARLAHDSLFSRPVDAWCDRHGGALDHEIVQLSGGLREVVKKERGSMDHAERTAAELSERGFVTRVYVGPAGPGGSSKRTIAFAGRSRAAVDEAASIEAGIVGPIEQRGALVRRMGALLGYPSCCIEHFASSPEQDDATHIARLVAADSGALAPHDNWAAIALRPFSHFPCRPACAGTAKLAKATLALVRQQAPRWAAAVERALASVVLIQTADRFVVLEGARVESGGVVSYEGVLSHKNLGMDASVLGRPAFRAFYLEVVAPLEQGDRVERTRTSLRISRRGVEVTEIAFASGAPRLLDFTRARGVRRLPLAEGRQDR